MNRGTPALWEFVNTALRVHSFSLELRALPNIEEAKLTHLGETSTQTARLELHDFLVVLVI